jgi:hypothetical protein
MRSLAGLVLLLGLLGVYALALRVIWRAPARALGILVAGMAVHNIVLMFLIRLGTPSVLIRVAQSWKEGILLLLLVLAAAVGRRAWLAGRRPQFRGLDLLMASFTAVVVIYFFIPPSLLGGNVSLSQRILGTRVLLLLPLLYLFGRLFFDASGRDIRWNLGLISGAAAFVGLVGMAELWLLPTRAWLDAGVNQFSAWLGFNYHGPQGLPENFFQLAAPGLYLRRMVSTYISPLPIAYTGLLVVPIAIGLSLPRNLSTRERTLRFVALALVVTGMLFSVTRLALILLIGEFALLAFLWRRRWLIVATPLVAALVVGVLFVYPKVGPLVTADLQPVHHRGAVKIVSSNDPSLTEHSATLAYDIQYVLQHPLGAGLGVSIHRFGQTQGTGESAVFDVLGEIGFLGGLLYGAAYAMILVYGLRGWLQTRDDPLRSSLPLLCLVGGLALAPITATSDVWSDFSITFLIWWAAGSTVSLVWADRRRQVAPAA